MAAGGFLRGTLARQASVSIALAIAAGGLVVGLLAVMRYRLGGTEMDLTPSQHWPVPLVGGDVQHDDGPALVTIEYRINPAKRQEFVAAMQELQRARLRDGAIRWDLFRDMADQTRYVETFVVESWAEHLRQHERVALADRVVQ